MQADPLLISAQISEDKAAKTQQIVESSLSVKVKQGKKKLIVSDLNLNNPQDRALSLCLKMVEMRKKRQVKQSRLIQEIRKSRVWNYNIGAIPQVIARDHFIARHEYLRQAQYRIDRPKIVINLTMAGSHLVGDQRKKALQREIQILQKSKQLTHRYEIKRMVQEILDEAVDHSIIMYERKKKFHIKNVKTQDSKLENEWQRRAKGKKGSLSLSRVIDMKMAPSDQSKSQQNNEDEEEQKTEKDMDNSESQDQNQSPQHEDKQLSQEGQGEQESSKSEGQEQEEAKNEDEQSDSSDHA